MKTKRSKRVHLAGWIHGLVECFRSTLVFHRPCWGMMCEGFSFAQRLLLLFSFLLARSQAVAHCGNEQSVKAVSKLDCVDQNTKLADLVSSAHRWAHQSQLAHL